MGRFVWGRAPSPVQPSAARRILLLAGELEQAFKPASKELKRIAGLQPLTFTREKA